VLRPGQELPHHLPGLLHCRRRSNLLCSASPTASSRPTRVLVRKYDDDGFAVAFAVRYIGLPVAAAARGRARESALIPLRPPKSKATAVLAFLPRFPGRSPVLSCALRENI
jgi:hypothetical protein